MGVMEKELSISPRKFRENGIRKVEVEVLYNICRIAGMQS